MSKRIDKFCAGYCLAVANLIHGHGASTEAWDTWNSGGFSFKDFERTGATDFDLDAIRQMYEERGLTP